MGTLDPSGHGCSLDCPVVWGKGPQPPRAFGACPLATWVLQIQAVVHLALAPEFPEACQWVDNLRESEARWPVAALDNRRMANGMSRALGPGVSLGGIGRAAALLRCLPACIALGLAPAGAQTGPDAERQRLKSLFEHEIQFRIAAIHVAWSAEAVCDHVTEIEPFVLWSTHAARRRLTGPEQALLLETSGMDEQWRVAWLDEAAPDGLELGQAVVAINDRRLPQGGTRMEMAALLAGGSPLTNDDQAFWDVLLKAREQAAEGEPMRITLADGRKLEVPTQTGCAGSVTASAFDSTPELFWRQGNQRARIPGNALLEASSRDEFRWLAAFGTYFQASRKAIGGVQRSESLGTAFAIGRVLALALPGGNLLLGSVESLTQRTLEVDGVVGGADLFASEVVAAMGGDPETGLRLNERFAARGLKVDVLAMSAFRRSNVSEQVRQLRALQAQAASAAAAQVPEPPQAGASPVQALPIR
jgi:hypothetical protein